MFSVAYFSAWISDHPVREGPESPFWIQLTGKKRLKAKEYKDVQWQLKKIAKRAGIKRRIYPHLFRHTRAIRLLAGVPETIGAKYMGRVNEWQQDGWCLRAFGKRRCG